MNNKKLKGANNYTEDQDVPQEDVSMTEKESSIVPLSAPKLQTETEVFGRMHEQINWAELMRPMFETVSTKLMQEVKKEMDTLVGTLEKGMNGIKEKQDRFEERVTQKVERGSGASSAASTTIHGNNKTPDSLSSKKSESSIIERPRITQYEYHGYASGMDY